MLAVFEASGAQRVALYGLDGTPLLTTASPGVVQGPAAHDAPAAGQPLRVAGVYRAAAPSVADGDVVDLLADAAGRPLVDMARIGGLAPTVRTPADGEALAGALLVEAVLRGHNGSALDLWRGNTEGVLLASAARTATTNSAIQTNHNARGAMLFLRISAASGTGGLQVRIIARDVAANRDYQLNANPSAETSVGDFVYELYPGSTAGAALNVKQRTAAALPRTWWVQVAHLDGSSYTYSLAYALIV